MIPAREMQAINYDASVFIIDLVDKEKVKVTSDLRWNYLAHCKVVPYIAGMMVFNFVFMVHLINYMKPSLIPEENGMCQLYDNVSLLTMITTEPDIFENFWSLTKTDFAKTVLLVVSFAPCLLVIFKTFDPFVNTGAELSKSREKIKVRGKELVDVENVLKDAYSLILAFRNNHFDAVSCITKMLWSISSSAREHDRSLRMVEGLRMKIKSIYDGR